MSIEVERRPNYVVEELWASDVGADSWTEPNDGRRIFWTPKGVWAAGNQYDGNATSSFSSSVDTFLGAGPAFFRAHIFTVEVDTYDELLVQWSGECVSSSGFAINAAGAGPNYPRTFWADWLMGWAVGVVHSESDLIYTQFPPVMVYNSAQQNTNQSVMSQHTGSDQAEARIWAGGCRLTVRGCGYEQAGLGAPNAHRGRGGPCSLPWDGVFGTEATGIARGVLFRGYTQTNGAGASISRLPQAGDRYGAIIQIGLDSDMGGQLSGVGAPYSASSRLRITGLKTVYFALYSTGSFSGAPNHVLFNQGPGNSHVVKGRIYAKKIKY